ncbi:MAG: Hsp33 family molecular chaperone HslO [Betaproteobacteria bacterium]|nr:Hsp33 family molecular chaperone HslO [Betaproteobacteria bacterium]
MMDSLQRFVFEHAPVRGEIVQLGATWRAVLERREYPAPLRAVLGELMAAAALLSALLKFEGTLIMQAQGKGPVTLLVVECASDHSMRAIAHWQGDLPEATLKGLLGDGRFAITLDPQDGKQKYQGIVSLEGATVAEVLEHYMAASEQLDTRFWLAASEAGAAGMLLQRLPGQDSVEVDAWDRATHLGATLTARELLELPAGEIIHRLYHEEDIRVFQPKPVVFRCSCTRERVMAMLRMLGYDEVRSVLAERGNVEVSCDFCNRRYTFDRVDAEQVFAAEIVRQPESTRH